MVATNKNGIHYAWIIMIGCCFMQAGSLGAILDACGVFFVPICNDLGFTRAELSMYLTFYFITTIIAMPVVGRMISKYNINILLSVMFALTAAAVFAMGFYNQPWQWWISGVVFGFCGSFIFVIPTPILIGNWFHKRKGVALGIAMSFSGIGGAVFSPIFTMLIQTLGWRTAYMIAAVIMAVCVLPFTMFVFKLHPSDKNMLPYGFDPEKAEEAAKADAEQKSGVPAKKAFKSFSFWMMFLFCGFAAYFAGFNSHLPGFAISVGHSAMVGSTLLTAVMVGNCVEKLFIGILNDKLGVQFTVHIQLGMIVCGLLLLTFGGSNLVLLYLGAFLFGAQNSLYSVSNPLLIRQLFGDKEYPKIFTTARIGTGIIGCLGPVTIAGIFDVTGSFYPTFAVGIGVAIACGIVVILAETFRKKLQWEDQDGNPMAFEDVIKLELSKRTGAANTAE